MPHFHLSMQHGDDMILKRMKRRHLRDHSVAFCQQVKALRPDAVFSADMIAGFPTEDEAMFENALSIVDACGLSRVHVFPFSPREGTPAAKMPQLDRALVKERAARLRAKSDQAWRRHLAAWRGRTGLALFEKPGFARFADFTAVRIAANDGVPGDLAPVMITGDNADTLTGERCAMAQAAR